MHFSGTMAIYWAFIQLMAVCVNELVLNENFNLDSCLCSLLDIV